MKNPLLILLAVILLLPNLFNLNIFKEKGYDHKEEYDPSLAYINSVARLEKHVDSIANNLHARPSSYEYVFEITSAIRKRFYHDFSHLTLSENWLAAFAGKTIETGLACKVDPESILQHNNAACSQQAIVMMALLRDKGITYRHLGFPHHYALDVLIEGKWYFFDPNMEPNMTREQRSQDGWKYQSDSLKQYYDPAKMTDMEYALGDGLSPEKGAINEKPAKHASAFQSVTKLLSKTLWFVPLLIILFGSGLSFSLHKLQPAFILPAKAYFCLVYKRFTWRHSYD